MALMVSGRRPVSEDFEVSFGFGEKYKAETVKRLKLKHTVHQGIDFKCVIGTPIYAWRDGFVARVEQGDGNSGWGNWVAVYSDMPKQKDAVLAYYCHLKMVHVQAGKQVMAGDLIGYSGESGAAAGAPHLHFETRYTPSNEPFEAHFI